MPKRKKRRSRRDQPPAAPPAESPLSRALTVFWMTSLLATLAGQVIALALQIALWLGGPPELVRFTNLMLLIAAATGVVCLTLTPIVLRWRDTPPPAAITRFAIAASLVPIVLVVAAALRGG